MASPPPTSNAGAPKEDSRDGPFPTLLLILTMVTGLVDAISYLKLGHVFVANMTGNVILLGLAVAGATDVSLPASLVAMAAFMAGALGAGGLTATAEHRGRLLAIAIAMEIVLVGVALIVAAVSRDSASELVHYALIVFLAVAMGLQTATARRLGVPDLMTTVLTSTLAGLAADLPLAGNKSRRTGRRLIATCIMLIGAAIGALLIFHIAVTAVLALSLVLLTVAGIAAYRVSSSSAAWATGA